MDSVKNVVSNLRRLYEKEFFLKAIAFIASIVLLNVYPESFDVLYGFAFFKKFSVLHIMWAIWMVDMIMTFFPYIKGIPLGAKKHFLELFKPSELFNTQRLLEYVKKCGSDVIMVALVWGALNIAIGILFWLDIISRNILFIITMFYYLSDVICILFWCPFRVFFMHNRCCTTCRIYNWGHIMMFSPFVFIPSFYTWTIFLMSFAIFLRWEISFARNPERFWEGTNLALRCSRCTDRLCKNRLCAPDYRELPPYENK